MPLVLIHGDNIVAVDAAIQAVRALFNEADVVTLDGPTMPLPLLSEASRTAGLFDPERLVIVNALHERMKSTKKGDAEAEEIRIILASVAPTTTLLLVGREMPPDHALVADVRAAGGEVQAHMMPRKQDLPRWIAARVRERGSPIDPDAADLLAETVGANPVMLDTEIEKLATYAGEGGRITVAGVDALVGQVAQESVFALVDAVASGDRARALGLLHAQLDTSSGTPVDFALYLIRMLARQVRILLRIRVAQEAGRSQAQIVSELKIQRYFVDRYMRQARRLSRERLTGAFERLAALEHGLKTSSVDAVTGLDLLVAELCA